MTTETRELLGLHETLSTYEGTKTRPCRFKTALCPDKCGHAVESSLFKVDKYLSKVDHEDTLVGFETKDTAAEHLATLKTLTEGDKVNLTWKHEKVEKKYADGTGSSGGERTISALSKAGASAKAADAEVAESRELLATHKTISEYESTTFRKCMHLTSLCPDKCGHGGNVAVFKVLGYTEYNKPGQYGDEQQQHFHVKLEGIGAEKDTKVVETIKSLKPQQKVILDWNHDYVTKGGSKFPERPVVKIQPVSEEEAAKLLPKTTD